ncbi:hypothetical protein KIW84_012786 [Lathyrus oleraceus]|uniref:Arabidopsis retrotransposon Orf1 C-terminal domain-containing protein n=1 Tax=Pisum sativum TaxID=3888 RepID=A0A9D5GWT8_PEA|nr:hypothetical protein KIW84_012786 [Pisum sativum]
MAQVGNASFEGVIFWDGRDGRKQQKKFEALLNREIIPTRYAKDTCLHRLRLLDSVNWMISSVGLSHFCTRKDATYARLTREFPGSLIYTVQPGTASTFGFVQFKMFNMVFSYSTDQLVEFLNFPYEEGVVCEAPLDIDWEEICQDNLRVTAYNHIVTMMVNPLGGNGTPIVIQPPPKGDIVNQNVAHTFNIPVGALTEMDDYQYAFFIPKVDYVYDDYGPSPVEVENKF